MKADVTKRLQELQREKSGFYPQISDFYGLFFSPFWQDPDSTKVSARQDFWKSQSGTTADLAARMLTEDPVMQMVAVNWMLENFCRQVMKNNEFAGEIKEDVKFLIALQYGYINPEFEKLKIMMRKR